MIAAVVCAAIPWTVATAQQKGAAPARVDMAALLNAAKDGNQWVTYGRDYAETHYSPLKLINDANVKRLGLAWSLETGSPAGAAVESTPLFHNGTLYGSLAWNVMFAADARTGKMKWRWDPEIKRERIQGLCCGAVNRGVALYNGKVYQGMLDGRVVALDANTGKLVWSVQDTAPESDVTLTSAVRVVKGKLIVGSAGAEHGVRGYFTAYDAETGKRLWRFYTVPGDPSKPVEHPDLKAAARTWTGQWWKQGGGGTVWDAMAYDPEADLLYVGTGNGGPWNRNYRSPQGGDNLYIASILAVKPDTGKLAWYFQTTPGDQWDYASTQPLVLADLTINGRARKVIMQAPKNGFFYVLDRLTGEFVTGNKLLQRVTWATGLDAKGRPVEAKGARYKDQAVLISPGQDGAHNWQPMSFSPITKLVYVTAKESATAYTPDLGFRFAAGYWNTGTTTAGPRRPPNTQVKWPEPPETMPQPEGGAAQPVLGFSFLAAWDPVANREVWRAMGPGIGGTNGGGTLATAGNLVFHGNHAFDAKTGKVLWTVEGLSGVADPITYMLDGKQYVAMLARPGPSNRLFVFALDAKRPLPPASEAR
ncbi:MAG: hypothetical protein RL328_2066 [Acidobacteriota bacterium]